MGNKIRATQTPAIVKLAFAVAVLATFFIFLNLSGKNGADPTGLPNATMPSLIPSATVQTITPADCVTSVEERTVRGSSMTGLLYDGDVVSVQFGYYGCNDPKTGDVALVRFAGDSNPLVKVIKATPGDSFSLPRDISCGWNVIVNGQAVRNYQGEKYCISSAGYRMLSLYVQSYNGVIPQDAYLVLGNLVAGSTDSTRFGLTSRGSLLGKVEIPPKSA